MRYRIRIDSERCKGCLLCMEVCPCDVLRLSSAFNRRVFHYVEADAPERCTGCQGCADICPDAAVEIAAVRGGDGSPALPPAACRGPQGGS